MQDTKIWTGQDSGHKVNKFSVTLNMALACDKSSYHDNLCQIFFICHYNDQSQGLDIILLT